MRLKDETRTSRHLQGILRRQRAGREDALEEDARVVVLVEVRQKVDVGHQVLGLVLEAFQTQVEDLEGDRLVLSQNKIIISQSSVIRVCITLMPLTFCYRFLRNHRECLEPTLVQ